MKLPRDSKTTDLAKASGEDKSVVEAEVRDAEKGSLSILLPHDMSNGALNAGTL